MENRLTKFELVTVLGQRATQISNGAPPTIDVGDMKDPVKIAEAELYARTIPITIIRKYPKGKKVFRVCEMLY